MYSQEEIEKKRQQALERQKQKNQNGSASNTPTAKPNNTTNIKSFAYQKPGNFYSQSPSTKNTFVNKNGNVMKHQSPSHRFNPMKAQNPHGKPNFNDSANQITLNCYISSNKRFSIETSKFSAEVNELCKTIPTKSYDPNTRTWSFDIVDYSPFYQKAVALNVKVTGIPPVVLRIFRDLPKAQEKASNNEIDLSSIDESLMNSVYPFQKEGIKFGIQRNGRCLIADDMGLGKTRQALGIAHYYKDDWPLIIITPSSVKYQWSEAIFEHLKSVPIQQIQIAVNNRQELEDFKVLIISYDLVKRRIDQLSARKFGVIIADESHYLKGGQKVERYKCVEILAKKAKRIILLTGTPALSRPIELYSQVNLVIPNFMKYYDYAFRYCAAEQTAFCLDVSGASNTKELELLLKATCLIRRLKSDVLTQLPSKIRQKVVLDPNLLQLNSKSLKKATKVVEDNKLKGGDKQAALFEYYAETGIAKQKAVCDYIEDLIENQEKFLVFAHHHNMLDAIAELLQKKKTPFMRIDGKTSAEQRKSNVDAFQNNDKLLVALLSITAANAGITLTAARLVIFAELTWNPGILCQAEDRVHRIGQSENVVIRYLVAPKTADDLMWPAIKNKINVLNEVGLDQNFDLNSAEMSVQVCHNQEVLDSYFETDMDLPGSSEKEKKNQESTENNSSQNGTSTQLSNSLKAMMDDDDDAFDEIDLDNFG